MKIILGEINPLTRFIEAATNLKKLVKVGKNFIKLVKFANNFTKFLEFANKNFMRFVEFANDFTKSVGPAKNFYEVCRSNKQLYKVHRTFLIFGKSIRPTKIYEVCRLESWI